MLIKPCLKHTIVNFKRVILTPEKDYTVALKSTITSYVLPHNGGGSVIEYLI